MTKAPNTWDECKTEKQKKAFIKELERRGKEPTTSFEEYLKEEYGDET